MRANPSGNGKPGYQVENAGAITRRFEQIQRQAKRQGRGPAVLRAIKRILQRLHSAPREFGEPL